MSKEKIQHIIIQHEGAIEHLKELSKKSRAWKIALRERIEVLDELKKQLGIKSDTISEEEV